MAILELEAELHTILPKTHLDGAFSSFYRQDLNIHTALHLDMASDSDSDSDTCAQMRDLSVDERQELRAGRQRCRVQILKLAAVVTAAHQVAVFGDSEEYVSCVFLA